MMLNMLHLKRWTCIPNSIWSWEMYQLSWLMVTIAGAYLCQIEPMFYLRVALSVSYQLLTSVEYFWSFSRLKNLNYALKWNWSIHVIGWTGNCSHCCIFILTFQIRSQVASLPSTRIAMRLPSIGFHFSPSRYHRLMQVAKIFQEEDAEHSAVVRPWDEADYVGWHYHLARKVILFSFCSNYHLFF